MDIIFPVVATLVVVGVALYLGRLQPHDEYLAHLRAKKEIGDIFRKNGL